jgi:hypothetical protein
MNPFKIRRDEEFVVSTPLVQKWSRVCSCILCRKPMIVTIGSDGSYFGGRPMAKIDPYSENRGVWLCEECHESK